VTVRWATGFLDFPAGLFEDGVLFWSRVTGYALSPRRGAAGEFATLLPPQGDAFLRVQRVGSSVPGCHLDLHVDDLDDRAELAVRAGATRVGEEPGLVVLRSPGGLGFCLAEAAGESMRPAPTAWSSGSRGLIDQLCLDIPPADFDDECDFFSTVTGWPRRRGSRPEFDVLDRPDGIPLRLLLQRLGSQASTTTAHLDWACDDVDVEVRRHVDLGATVRHEMPAWTTLVDPAGLSYCVTSRSPDTGRLS
jgi:hypothetical protein